MAKVGGPFLLVVGTAIVALAACKRPGAESVRGPTDPFAGLDCSENPDTRRARPHRVGTRLPGTQLDKLRRQGVVAVRYETHGCDVSLELLPDCIGPKNRYVYSPYKSTDTKIAKSSNELLSQLPVGAANVLGRLGSGRALRTD